VILAARMGSLELTGGTAGATMRAGIGQDGLMAGSEGSAGLPIIDVSPLLGHGPTTARAEVAGRIQAACRERGFFYVAGHGVPAGLLDELASAGAEFFALPLEDKLEIAMERGGRAWRGSSRLAPSSPTGGRPEGGSVLRRRALALGPELAASGLARRPYDLRHAALSLGLNAGGDPAQVAARAGHRVAVLLTVYSHCIHGRDELLNQQIGHVLGLLRGHGPCPSVESQRLHRPRDGRGRRPLYVRGFPARPADGPWTAPTSTGHMPAQQP
jgi:hypothetical protein